ncbi:MAG: hypothetical protein EOO47_14515 [Flavobacterium sp.]|nr:MAG: hypothetical protein EOO47_14515 [Flavobacterium sp.]
MHPKIKDKLTEAQLIYQEIKHATFDKPINSPLDFAHALGYEIGRITKSVFLRAKTKDKYIMAVCSCHKKLDFPKLAQLAKVNKLEVADKIELAEMIGYPPTGVCAIGLTANIEVFIDAELLDHQTILVGSGEVAIEIELHPQDLLLITNAKTDEISLA